MDNKKFQIVNCMEKAVFDHLDNIINENKTICKCEKCRMDVAVLTLNTLKSHYVLTLKGGTFTRLKLYETQSEADIIFALTKAIEKVEGNPQHEELLS